MVRWGVLAGCAAVIAGAAFVTGSTVPNGSAKLPAPGDTKAEPKTVVVVGQKNGYFNMAKVMRDSKNAKAKVQRLNDTKERMSVDLTKMRNKYNELKTAHEKATDKDEKDRLARELLNVARKIEDTDRDINKALNDKASAIIAGLYDEIHAVVATIARENALTAMLTYPDAVTPEEANSPYIKELKLKPPALQPFYLDPAADYSDEIVRRINKKFAAEDDK